MTTPDSTERALPPLPDAAMRAAPVGYERWPFPKADYFTAEQMRAYVLADRASLGAAQVPATLVYALCEEIGNLHRADTEFDRGNRFAAKRIANAVCSQAPYVSQSTKESPCIPTSFDSTMRLSACAGIAGAQLSDTTFCAKPDSTVDAAQVPAGDDKTLHGWIAEAMNVQPKEATAGAAQVPSLSEAPKLARSRVHELFNLAGELTRECWVQELDATIAALSQPSQQGTK